MVSPAPSQSHPLSYAERAKKAQNNTSKASAQLPPQSVVPSSNTPSASMSTVGPPAVSVAVSPPSVRASSPKPARRNTNGDMNQSDSSIPAAAPKPSVNVWAVRKEQMAQARAQPLLSAPDEPQPSSSRASETSSTMPSSPSTTAAAPPTGGASSLASSLSVGPVRHDDDSDDDDAFVVRPRVPPAVPLVLDAESWPAMGAAEPTVRVASEREDNERRKSEKTKWVPISAQELQAAADAVHPPRSRHIRPASNQPGRTYSRPSTSHPGSASQSHPGSHTSSAPHSHPASISHSHAGSVTHSHAQSRTGSSHSSPRGGRRLASPPPPRMAPHPSLPLQLTNGAPSYYPAPQPPFVAPPQPYPPQIYPVGPPPTYPTASPVSHPSVLPVYPSYAPAVYPYAAPYGYWPPPPRLVHPPPIENQPSYAPEYSQEHSGVSSHSASHSHSNSISSPYEHEHEHGPSPSAGVPPPTLVARPPPPGESDAVAGYRAVPRRARELSFGSINLTGPGQSPSPRPEVSNADEHADAGEAEVAQGDGDDAKTKKVGADEEDESGDTTFTTFSIGVGNVPQAAEVKVIDLTDAETKWEFGTTARVAEEVGQRQLESAFATLAVEPTHHNTLGITTGQGPTSVPPAGISPVQAPMPAYRTLNGASPPYSLPVAHHVDDSVDDLRVKDYGWGFGRGSAADYARNGRRDRDPQLAQGEYHGRPRRGVYNYDRGFERGRRGRGANGAGGRGYNTRGGGRGGFPRQPPYATAQPALTIDTNGFYMPPAQPPPMSTTTYIQTGYDYMYPFSPQSATTTTTAATTASLQAPLPVPQTTLSFPLDPTRYYLLGQLEYYLSPQNIVQDFFLRQKMDSQGWIPITLLASFNRVRQLTAELPLVRDVLVLSSLVEVRDNYVRMRQWESFVLPDAPISVFEGGSLQSQYQDEYAHRDELAHHDGPSHLPEVARHGLLAAENDEVAEASGHDGEGDGEDDCEEDEEEEVVFVLGGEAGRAWTPERKTG